MTTPGAEDRAIGAMVGSACGDALGAGYEFGGPLPESRPVSMKGGGPFGFAPGEWTDDTSMAIPLLQLAAAAERMRNAMLSRVVHAWRDWARSAPDVGNHTRAALKGIERFAREETPAALYREDWWGGPALWSTGHGHLEEAAWESAADVQRRRPSSAGNGSLMRNTPLGIRMAVQEGDAVFTYAAQQSMLTHQHRDAVEACVIWAAATAHAIRTGELDVTHGLTKRAFLAINCPVSIGLPQLSSTAVDERIALWRARIEEAEAHPPAHFTRNGWVVQALQGAWSSIVHSGDRHDDDPAHVRRALEAAVRGGNDTDTVAAIAGGLIGAAYGVSALPLEWTRRLHGWPGWRADDLARRAALTYRGHSEYDPGPWAWVDHVDAAGWSGASAAARLPADPMVALGGIETLRSWGMNAGAVVSLCPVGRKDIPSVVEPENRVAAYFPDAARSSDARLDFTFREAADAIAELRREDLGVLVHCMDASTRTPAVAALYSARHRGVPIERAWADVERALPRARIDPRHRAAVDRVAKEARS